MNDGIFDISCWYLVEITSEVEHHYLSQKLQEIHEHEKWPKPAQISDYFLKNISRRDLYQMIFNRTKDFSLAKSTQESLTCLLSTRKLGTTRPTSDVILELQSFFPKSFESDNRTDLLLFE